jgi:hypothetical protein
MSGDYVINCGCGESSGSLDRTQGDTIIALVSVLPELEKLIAADLEIQDLRGTVYDPVHGAIEFLLAHWRHGTLEYYYTNNNQPAVPLKIPERVGLPTPCPCCKGRRLVPCPEC